MKILDVLRQPRYLAIAIVAAIAMMAFYSYTQVLFIAENLDVWYTNIPLHNFALFLTFSGIFGVTLAFQIWNWKQPKVCAIKKQSTPGAIGTVMSFLVVQCPACASLGALFLPISVIGALTFLSIPITLLSIGLLLFTIFRLGGFKNSSLSPSLS